MPGEEGMKKKMECKAHKALGTGATLAVVRIPRAFATKQSAFYSPRNLVLHFFKGLANLRLNLIAQLDIVGKQLFHGLASLGKLLVAVAEP